jgi:hypothetical protein
MLITICRLYDSFDDATQTVNDLEAAGVPAANTSIISNNSDSSFAPAADASDGAAADAKANTKANTGGGRGERFENAVMGAAIGATAGTAGTLIGSLTLLAIPGVGAVAGAGWLLVMMIAGMAAGGVTGGLLGALTSAGVSEADAQLYAEGVRRGGTLVTTRVPEAEAARTEGIMNRSAVDIGERAADYRQLGWQAFDPFAAPYTADQVRNEREMHRAA